MMNEMITFKYSVSLLSHSCRSFRCRQVRSTSTPESSFVEFHRMDLSFKEHTCLSKALQLRVHHRKVKVGTLPTSGCPVKGGRRVLVREVTKKPTITDWALQIQCGDWERCRMTNTAPKLCTKTGLYGRMDRWKSLDRQRHRTGQTGQGFSKRSSPESLVSVLLRWFLWPYLEGCVPSKSGQHRRILIKMENHLNAEQKKWTAPERPDGLNTSTEWRLMQEKCILSFCHPKKLWKI